MSKQTINRLKLKLQMTGANIYESNSFAIATIKDGEYKIYRLLSDDTVDKELLNYSYVTAILNRYFVLLSPTGFGWEELYMKGINNNILADKEVKRINISGDNIPLLPIVLSDSYMIITKDAIAYKIEYEDKTTRIWNSTRISVAYNPKYGRYEFNLDQLSSMGDLYSEPIFAYMDKSLNELIVLKSGFIVSKIELRK